ncbi:MAG: helix-turn-helix transcriptional regulator [Lachnospiraceae bacterium]|nr:helix-turn-helix transcriptional regulator [Lachnospiraceae bacterium]
MKVMLNQLLDQKGISQNKIAKDTGISTTTLRNLNHNRTTRINFDLLDKICTYLDCGVEDILCVEKNTESHIMNA